jgi:DNA-nicking Smr family endonuclease
MARKISDDEQVLWREVTRSVAPLRRRRAKVERAAADLVVAEKPEPPRKRASSGPKPAPTVRKVAPAQSAPAPPLMPIERRLKQRLARGSQSIDARIDLHGRTQEQAHDALLRFLQKAQTSGAKIVLVITGKGGSAEAFASERGVLKRQVPLWLQLPEFRSYVLAVEEAHSAHGGAGALYVRLRRARVRS